MPMRLLRRVRAGSRVFYFAVLASMALCGEGCDMI
jgi:hypothetical protein